MFIIKKFEIKDGTPVSRIPIYPIINEDDYLHNFKDSNIGECISTLGVETIIGNGIFRLGDSSLTFVVHNTGVRGNTAMSMMKKYAEDFVSIAEEAMPEMSADYQAFYRHMIDDFTKNGVEMPHYGRL